MLMISAAYANQKWRNMKGKNSEEPGVMQHHKSIQQTQIAQIILTAQETETSPGRRLDQGKVCDNLDK